MPTIPFRVTRPAGDRWMGHGGLDAEAFGGITAGVGPASLTRPLSPAAGGVGLGGFLFHRRVRPNFQLRADDLTQSPDDVLAGLSLGSEGSVQFSLGDFQGNSVRTR